ncbi:Phage baseplate assembly protein V [Candidatus Hepatincolaceae symbiont of Richtersius coronifer]
MDLITRISKLEDNMAKIIRFGLIKQVDLATNTVIVDLGNNLATPELPYLINSSGNAKVYFVPKIGDQVMILAQNSYLESAVVIPSIRMGSINGVEDEWRLEFAQGSIKYKEGKLNIEATSQVTIKSPKAIIDSDQIILGGEDGGEVVCKMHTCSFTGGPHIQGSNKIKGAL